MPSSNLFSQLFELLILPGQRIPAIYNWMMENIWSNDNYKSKEIKKYFEDGEKHVLKLEDLALASATGIYEELASLASQNFSLLRELTKPKTGLVIFDGVSLREVPILLKLAEDTGYAIKESSFKVSSLPSDTVSFVERRILDKAVAPSQLENRHELKEKNIKAFYYDTPIRSFELPSNGNSYLLWSSFPDGTYSNFEARNSLHFETIARQFDVVWKNVLLAIPKDYRIIVTSDHGYVYLNAGFESSEKGESALKFLQQERFRFYDNEDVPQNLSELQIVPQRNLAMIRGRIKNRPKGHSANKVFRHGGLSLMEMLTPWLVLEKK